jgi:hypothetical protein
LEFDHLECLEIIATVPRGTLNGPYMMPEITERAGIFIVRKDKKQAL